MPEEAPKGEGPMKRQPQMRLDLGRKKNKPETQREAEVVLAKLAIESPGDWRYGHLAARASNGLSWAEMVLRRKL